MASYKLNTTEILIEPLNPNTAYIRWTKFTKAHTKEISVQWYFRLVNTTKFLTEGPSTVSKSATYASYSIPNNVVEIKVSVKPISNTYDKKNKNGKVVKKNVAYFKSTAVVKKKKVTGSSLTPPTPTVTIDGLKLTATVENLPSQLNSGKIVFEVYENDTFKRYSPTTTPHTGRASITVDISAGKRYKVRAKSKLSNYADSEWSDFSNSTEPLPTAVKFKTCRAVSHNAVKMTWDAVDGSPTYEIQWARKVSDFNDGTVAGSQTVTNDTSVTVTVDGSGEFYFRIRATKNEYKTPWYPQGYASAFNFISHVVLGFQPDPPTTWSEAATVKIGDTVRLYWTHNSRDSSIAYASYLRIVFSGGALEEPITENRYLRNFNYSDELHAADPWVWEINTSIPYITYEGDTIDFTSGVNIEWQASTTVYPFDDDGHAIPEDELPISAAFASEMTDHTKIYVYVGDEEGYVSGHWYYYNGTSFVDGGQYEESEETYIDWRSDWSVKRKVEVIVPPSLAMFLSDSTEWAWDELNMIDGFTYYTPVVPNDSLDATFHEFPIGIKLEASPQSQNVLNYTLEVIAKESYDTIDPLGEETTILANQTIFSRYIVSDNHTEYVTLNANNIDLEDEQPYLIKATVTTDSGLTASAEADVFISWDEPLVADVTAEIAIDEDELTASICPYCTVDTDEEEPTDVLVEGVVMSVYRKNIDGEFIKIAENIPNDRSTFVTDPHPTLGFVTYRIIATLQENGSVAWAEVLEEVDQPGVVLTWDEYWSYVPNDELPEEYYYDNEDRVGKMLKLPYNVDINQTTAIDSVMVNYIGRKRPVSYYGTQLGETITLKTDLPRISDYGSGLTEEDETWAVETLALLRRLMVYTGDVYVRDSSGNGYWANVKVAFDNNHIALTIPITINVTRVEGGV